MADVVDSQVIAHGANVNLVRVYDKAADTDNKDERQLALKELEDLKKARQDKTSMSDGQWIFMCLKLGEYRPSTYRGRRRKTLEYGIRRRKTRSTGPCTASTCVLFQTVDASVSALTVIR